MILSISSSIAQVQIYYEDFSNGFPNNYKVFNEDTLIPYPTSMETYFIDFSSLSWVVSYKPFVEGDSAIASSCVSIADTFDTSYDGEKISDWLITDSIIIGKNTFLRWESFSYNYQVSPLRYEVYISSNKGDTTTDFIDPPVFTANPDSGGGSWKTHEILLRDFGYQNDTIYIAFKHSTETIIGLGNREADVLWIDDIELFEVYNIDGSIMTTNIDDYTKVNESYSLQGLFKNNGIDTIESFDLNWSVNGGIINSDNISGVSIPYQSTYNYSHTTNWQPTDTGYYTISIWADNFNGGLTDSNMLDDTLTITTYAMSKFPQKNIVLENITDASCGFCVDAHIMIDSNIRNEYSNVFVANIHATDAMSIPDGITVAEQYDDHPNEVRALIDRKRYSDQGFVEVPLFNYQDILWENKIIEQSNAIAPVELTMSNEMQDSSRELSIQVNARFFAPLNGQHRFNCYVIEDSVIGSGNGYDQNNFRNGQPGHPYENKDSLISSFVHRDVVRFMLGGPWGFTTIPVNPLPTTINNGDSFSIEYTITIPPTWDESKIHLIATVQEAELGDFSKRSILNAVAQKMIIVKDSDSVINPYTKAFNQDEVGLSLYPNPIQERGELIVALKKSASISIDLHDQLGRKIKPILSKKDALPGISHYRFETNDIDAGIYFIYLKTDNVITKVEKISVIK